MTRRPIVASLVLLAAVACAAPPPDADRDGVSDLLEAQLAIDDLPRLHESGGAAGPDACAEPHQRPVIYRARPVRLEASTAGEAIAITYVLLYEQDCGALGHSGDNEVFTVIVRHDAGAGRWTTVGATAIAHQGSPAQHVSKGPGTDIWISRNKHATFATFDACGDSDIPGDVCTEDGPSPVIYALLNAGEPQARLSNDAGDVMLEAGPNGHRTAGRGAHPDPETAHAFQLFRGNSIWDYEPFLGAGSLTAQLDVDPNLIAPPAAGAGTGRVRKDDDQ